MTRPAATGTRIATAPYLIISRVGPDSLHAQWLPTAGPGGFDVLLSSYDRRVQPVEDPAVLFEFRPGAKVAGYGEILRDHAALIRQYRYVALFDDDLATDALSLLALFRLIDGQGFKIAQPALDHHSYFTYACLLHHSGYRLRHVNFVEMMCPFFRSDILLDLAPLFGLGYESGIDLVWSALVHRQAGDLAVIDSIPVRHTRPVGAIKAVNGFVDGRVYETDIHAILKRFDLPWLPATPYGGIRSDGSLARNRLALFAHALGLARAIPIRSARFRLNAMVTYWVQLLRCRTRNVRAQWPPSP